MILLGEVCTTNGNARVFTRPLFVVGSIVAASHTTVRQNDV